MRWDGDYSAPLYPTECGAVAAAIVKLNRLSVREERANKCSRCRIRQSIVMFTAAEACARRCRLQLPPARMAKKGIIRKRKTIVDRRQAHRLETQIKNLACSDAGRVTRVISDY